MAKNKEYNEWYWKVYRWFKWESKHLHRDIWRGIVNLWTWLPIIWKDRDWDHSYLLKIVKKKIDRMHDYHAKRLTFVGSERVVEKMKLVSSLIEKVESEYYGSEYFDEKYYQCEMVVNEDGSLDVPTTYDNLKEYIEKYPSAKRKVLSNKKYIDMLGDEPTDFKIGMLMSIERHNKAKRILFRLLDDNTEQWWD
jgi:hypothetical protein